MEMHDFIFSQLMPSLNVLLTMIVTLISNAIRDLADLHVALYLVGLMPYVHQNFIMVFVNA